MSHVVEDSIAFIDLGAQRQRIAERIEAAIARVLNHGRFVLGPEVADFEQRLGEFCTARHAVACANGTDAIELALLALGAKPGDGVIVPSFTFCATAEPVAALGAVPVFAEVEAETFNLAPASVQQALLDAMAAGIEVAGIIAVDLFGLPADYEALNSIADDHGVWVVADAAQAFGAQRDGQRVGTLAAITTTSFFPAKPLGCYGDGGAVFTDSKQLATTLRSLCAHGKGTDKYDNVRIGKNSRLDTLQAAILIEKLAIFEDELRLRQAVADRYRAGLADVVDVPSLPQGVTSAWAQYTVILPPEQDRSVIQAHLRDRGIPTAVYYPKPLHLQTAYSRFPAVSSGLATSESLAERVLSLPMHPYLEAATQDRIIERFRDAITATVV